MKNKTFKYQLNNNLVTVEVQIAPRRHPDEQRVVVNTAEVESFCKSNKVPIGKLVGTTGPSVCSNDSLDSTTKKWTFEICAKYKKSLISANKSGILKKEQKTIQPRKRKKATGSVRARASRIATQKKKEQIKNESEST